MKTNLVFCGLLPSERHTYKKKVLIKIIRWVVSNECYKIKVGNKIFNSLHSFPFFNQPHRQVYSRCFTFLYFSSYPFVGAQQIQVAMEVQLYLIKIPIIYKKKVKKTKKYTKKLKSMIKFLTYPLHFGLQPVSNPKPT